MRAEGGGTVLDDFLRLDDGRAGRRRRTEAEEVDAAGVERPVRLGRLEDEVARRRLARALPAAAGSLGRARLAWGRYGGDMCEI